MSEMQRTHVLLPRELVEAIDRLVGPRHRSEFLAEAAAKELRHRKLMQAAEAAAGSLEHADIPGWETSEAAAEWVRASRRADEERLRRILERS